jgi:hypothetical protein
VLVDRADQRHHDRREQDEEAPEDEGVHQAWDEALEQLALPEDDHGLVADAARGVVVAAIGRMAGQDELRQEERAAREEAACDGDQGREPERAGDDRYALFAFLSSAVIAGTISCRSPMTA